MYINILTINNIATFLPLLQSNFISKDCQYMYINAERSVWILKGLETDEWFNGK